MAENATATTVATEVSKPNYVRTNLGSLSSYIGENTSYEPSSETNVKSSKRLSLKLTYPNGEIKYINCSENTSKDLRKSSTEEEFIENLKGLRALPVYKTEYFNEDGTPVLSQATDTRGNKLVDDEGEPIMVPLVLYSVGRPEGGGADMSKFRVVNDSIVETAAPVIREVSFEDLIG